MDRRGVRGAAVCDTPWPNREGARQNRPNKMKALVRQLVVFAGVGTVFTVVYALLYVLLREWLSAQWSNGLALILSTMTGTWGHRRVTFGVRGRARTVPHQMLGLALLAFGLVVTAGTLELLEVSVAEPSRLSELLVLAAANLGVGLVRFGAFRVAMVPQRTQRAEATRDDSERDQGMAPGRSGRSDAR